MWPKWRVAVAVLTLILMITGLFWALRGPRMAATPPTSEAEAQAWLTPAEQGLADLSPTGRLTLTSSKPLSAAMVRANLAVEPVAEFKVEQMDEEGRIFAIAPARALESGRIYRFRLGQEVGLDRPYQWSFQTRSEFRLLGTLPRNESTGVPLNTGIEFTFSHEDYEDLTGHLSINPEVKGRFERHRRTVAFVPAEPLQPNTIYTVTLREGLGRKGGVGSLGERRFSFETTDPASNQAPVLEFAYEMVEIPTKSAPFFQVWPWTATKEELQVSAFRYPHAEAFMEALQLIDRIPRWAYGSRNRYEESTAGLVQVSSFRTTLQSYQNGSYLLFPEPLPAGYYLANVRWKGGARQVRFQVTDLSYYVAESSTGTLVWLNDLTQGKAIGGATLIDPTGAVKGRTDQDGIAFLEVDQARLREDSQAPLLLVARSEGKEALLTTATRYGWYSSHEGLSQDYWKYLYLDRNLYKPNDTLHFWGVLHPREADARPVDSVRVVLTGYAYDRFTGDRLILGERTLPLQIGTFTGNLDLPNLTPGHYTVELLVGAESVATRGFEVATYAKPTYRLEVSADKEALFTGEPVTFRVKAAFFEGTPVPNMKLDYYLSDWPGSGTLLTNAEGEAEVTYTPPHETQPVWGPVSSLSFRIHGGEPEVGEVTAELYLPLYTRDLKVESQVSQTDGRATVTLDLSQVILGESPMEPYQLPKGPPVANREVEFTLVEMNWERIEEGQEYDFINKLFHTRYRYVPAHRELGSQRLVTDAEGRVSYTAEVDPEKQYEVNYRVRDSRGLGMIGSSYVSGQQFVYPNSREERWVRFLPEEEGQESAKLTSPVGFVLHKGQSRLQDRPGAFLFATARRGLQSYKVQDSPLVRVTMTEADLPMLQLMGIYFDGRTYFETGRTVWFDQEERRLQVTVSTDQETYRPGDEVRLSLSVVDKEGRPATGAVVNLNLVDEALLALRNQWVETLGDLYRDWIDPGIWRSRSSHITPGPEGPGGKGGDGDGVRREFKDTALFRSLITDSQGQASTSFKLPDNLTSWRLTYQAVRAEGMAAGSGTLSIPVRQPFFADLVLGERFLVGDRPVVQVRAYGSGLAGGEEVTFRVELEGPAGSSQGTAELERRGRPFTPHSVELPRLEAEGTYRLRLTATVGSTLVDALERSLLVERTGMRQKRVDLTLLQPGARLKGATDGFTMLTFLDWERGHYLELLEWMHWQWGTRFEMQLARTVAGELLAQHFERGEYWAEPEFEAFRYQTQEGSIAILPYSDGDLKLSVLVADLAPERFDRRTLSGYLQGILEDEGESRERQILALYGLAALEEPVLTMAQGLLARRDLTQTEQLYLWLALAKLGDLEAVRPHYRKLIAEHAVEIGQDLRVNLGGDRDGWLEATALVASLASKLGESEARRLLSYLTEQRPGESLILLEQLLAAKSGLAAHSGGTTSVTYSLGGQEVKKRLPPGGQFTLALQPTELATLQIRQVEGSLAAVTSYSVTGKPVVERQGGSIERIYSPSPENWRPGEIVTITLRYSLGGDAPEGGYELTDSLPAGLRYLERPWQFGQQLDWLTYNNWPMQVDGERVSFWASKNGRPIQYKARVISAGEYRAEEPLLQHQKSGLIYGLGREEVLSFGR